MEHTALFFEVKPKMELSSTAECHYNLSKRMLAEFGLRGMIQELVFGGLMFRNAERAYKWFCLRVAEEDRRDISFNSFSELLNDILLHEDGYWNAISE